MQRRRATEADVEARGDVWQRAGGVKPAPLGLDHHGRGAVAVEQRADDSAVEVAQPVVVLGPGRELGRHRAVGPGVAAQAEPALVGRPAAEAQQLWEVPLLQAGQAFGRLVGLFAHDPITPRVRIVAAARSIGCARCRGSSASIVMPG